MTTTSQLGEQLEDVGHELANRADDYADDVVYEGGQIALRALANQLYALPAHELNSLRRLYEDRIDYPGSQAERNFFLRHALRPVHASAQSFLRAYVAERRRKHELTAIA